ncbi:MAG: exo-alpha-sialidase [Chloroflexi bacterium]|nr:exo-alpha-sialidase [Chloroflexota bacterium]
MRFERQDLFTRASGGYTMYRIPGICVTPGGAVLAHAEARLGRGGDWDKIDIVVRRSLDMGVTWSEPRLLLDHRDYGEGPLHNFNTIVDYENGIVHALFCFGYARAFTMRSTDGGYNFSQPREITAAFEAFRGEYDWGVLAIGLPNGIRLRQSGRLLIPVWLSSSRTAAHRPNRCATIYSDDDGANWQRGELVPDIVPNLNEAGIVELEDGSALMNMRNGIGIQRRIISRSPDGISRWSAPQLDPQLREPTCQGTLFRHSWAHDGESRLLFCNPDNTDGKDAKGSSIFRIRKNLSIRLSLDEGKSWPFTKVIDAGYAGYSALAICPDESILCLYERGAASGADSDDHLSLARFDLAWLMRSEVSDA